MYTIDKRFIWIEEEQRFIRRIYDSEGNIVAYGEVYKDTNSRVCIGEKVGNFGTSCSLKAAKNGISDRLRRTLTQLNNESK